jgi:hypothetical protein
MKAPFHLWFVGISSLLWNLVGAGDYTLTQFRHPAYMAQFTPEQVAYFQSFPTWVVASWATAVWAGVLGSVLLLMRSRLAALAFAVSLLGMIAAFTHNFGLAEVRMTDIAGPEALWFSLLILVIGVAEWLYARWMRQTGYLG